MTGLFLIILNMSITASYAAIAVMLVRFLLRRAPKVFSYMLWSAVIIRLAIPVSFTSSFSLLRLVQPQANAGTLVPDGTYKQFIPAVELGISGINRLMNSSLPLTAPTTSVNLMQVILWASSIVWITGVVVFLLYSMISYLKVRARVRTATLVRDNIFETDQITTPFVCGFWKPRIYIPTGMGENELSYILQHEQTHITRRDYLIKPFAYLMLIIHWFNPLMWVSYALMSKDMEMSCDESVVNKLGQQIKGSYSSSLLSLSVSRSGRLTGSPLAFGESHVKARIKNILTYRQPSSQMVAGCILVIAVLIVGCTANPKPLQQPTPTIYSGYHMEQLLENKTLYVGGASKVGGLISGMPKPAGLEGNGMALQTTTQPYGVTIYYQMVNAADVVKNGVISGETFYRNSILLLALIDNLGSVTYSIADNAGQLNGESYSFTYTREQVEELLGEDVRQYAADEETLRQLIDRVSSLPLDESNTVQVQPGS